MTAPTTPTPTTPPGPARPWHPSWARVADHPCVTLVCSGCGYGPEAEWGTPHYRDVADALQAALEDERWTQDGDRLLCRSCAGEIVCARDGHDWQHHHSDAWTRSDGVVHPVWDWWYCPRCDEGQTEVDPGPAPGDPGPDHPTLPLTPAPDDAEGGDRS